MRLRSLFHWESPPMEETPLISYPTRSAHKVHVESSAASQTGLKGLPPHLECALLMHLNSPSRNNSGEPTNHLDAFTKFRPIHSPNIRGPSSSSSVPSPRTCSPSDAPGRLTHSLLGDKVSDSERRYRNLTPSEHADIENIPPVRPPSFSENGNTLTETPPKPWKKREIYRTFPSDGSTLTMAQLLSETKNKSREWQNESPSTSSDTFPPDTLSSELDLLPISIPERVLMPLPIQIKPNKKPKSSAKLKFGKLVSGSTTFAATYSSSSRPPLVLSRSVSENINRSPVPASMRSSCRFMNRVCFARPRVSVVPDDPVYIRDIDPNSVFKNLTEIGSGGSGTVFEATNTDGKRVAIKIVKPENRAESAALEMEIRMMNCTRHPNIIKCYETYEHDGFLWIVMELMKGGNLTAVLRKLYREKKRMQEPEIAFIIREVLKGVQFMHKLKRIHRDIKSDNILLTKDGRVKLADFGYCAQLTDKETHRNSVVGTPYWMAPELLCDEGYDYNVDLWSVGILAIECAQWIPPLMEHAPLKALEMICSNENPPKLEDPKGLWSTQFHNFVNTVLVKNPKERPTAEMLLEHAFLEKTAFRVDL